MRWLIATVLALIAAPATAQQVFCGDRVKIVGRLAEQWGEHMAGRGLQSNGSALFEFWVDDADGSWTILRTSANGTACVMATGQHWRDVVPEPLGTDG